MVYDGSVKDQTEESSSLSSLSSVNQPSLDSPSLTNSSSSSSRSDLSKKLGVRHPLKHRRFRAGGKATSAMADPTADVTVPSPESDTSATADLVADITVASPERDTSSTADPTADVTVPSPERDTSATADLVADVTVASAERDAESAMADPDSDVTVESPEMDTSDQVEASPDRATSDQVEMDMSDCDTSEGATSAEAREAAEHVEDDIGYMSGGWKSENGRLSCGYASFRGKRATMEDFYDAKSSQIEGKIVSLFGIFDGHGGSRAAEYLKEHLFNNLMKHPQFMNDTKLAISETYQKTDSDFLETETSTLRDDGSTASTAVLVDNHLYVANVGDSRAVISKAGKAIALSEDHKPNRSDERRRIENAGGIVMWAGTWRVGGVLAMSRAFGNRLLKQFVVAEPEIQEEEINDEVECLILASDGLWDVVPNEDAVSLVRLEEESEAAARKLTETAYMRGSADNITCIVVKFHHEKIAGDDSPPQIPAPSNNQS